MAGTTPTASPTLSPSDLAVGKQVEIEARTGAGINKPGGHGTITKIHTDKTKVDVKYALGGFEKDVELIHVKAHVELERGGRKRRDDVKMNVEHLGGLPKKKSKKKKRKGTSGAAKTTAVGVGGGGTKTIAAFRQVALSLPTGPLGLAIHQQESGHCLVTARNPEINSPVFENDIILSVNGIKLKDVEGGKSGWVQMFSSLVNMPREVVVSRRVDIAMDIVMPPTTHDNTVGMKKQRESSGMPNDGNGVKMKRQKTSTPPVRGKMCGACDACVREDCGACRHCLDKPKFGGPGKLRQKCIHRRCIVVGPKQKREKKEETGNNIAGTGASTAAPAAASFEAQNLMKSTCKDTDCFAGHVNASQKATEFATTASVEFNAPVAMAATNDNAPAKFGAVASTAAATAAIFEAQNKMNSTSSKDTDCFAGHVNASQKATEFATIASVEFNAPVVMAATADNAPAKFGAVASTAAATAASFEAKNMMNSTSSKETECFGGHDNIDQKVAETESGISGTNLALSNATDQNGGNLSCVATLSDDLTALRRQNFEDMQMFQVYIPQIVTVLNKRSGAFHGKGSQPTIKKEIQAAMGESFSSTALSAALREMLNDGELVKEGHTYKLSCIDSNKTQMEEEIKMKTPQINKRKEVNVPALPPLANGAEYLHSFGNTSSPQTTASIDLKARLPRVSVSPVAMATAPWHPADAFGKTITVSNFANVDNNANAFAGTVASTAAPATDSFEASSTMNVTSKERKSFGGHVDTAKKAASVRINASGDLIVERRHEMENTTAYRARIINVLNQQSGAHRHEGTRQTIKKEMQAAMNDEIANADFNEVLRKMVEDGELVCTYRLASNLMENEHTSLDKPEASILTGNIKANEKQSTTIESSDQSVSSAHSADCGADEYGALSSPPRWTETTSTTAPTLSPSDLAVGKQVEIEARTWAGINKPGGHGTITKIHTDKTKVDVKYALGGVEKDVELIHVKAHVELERGGRKRRDDVKMNVEHLGGLPKKKSKKKKKKKRKGTSGAAKTTAAGVGGGGGGTKTIAAFRQVALSLPTELESGSSLYPADCGAYEYGALNSTPLTSYVENDDCFGCENIMQESDVAGTLLESLSPLSLPGICLNEGALSD